MPSSVNWSSSVYSALDMPGQRDKKVPERPLFLVLATLPGQERNKGPSG